MPELWRSASNIPSWTLQHSCILRAKHGRLINFGQLLRFIENDFFILFKVVFENLGKYLVINMHNQSFWGNSLIYFAHRRLHFVCIPLLCFKFLNSFIRLVLNCLLFFYLFCLSFTYGVKLILFVYFNELWSID